MASLVEHTHRENVSHKKKQATRRKESTVYANESFQDMIGIHFFNSWNVLNLLDMEKLFNAQISDNMMIRCSLRATAPNQDAAIFTRLIVHVDSAHLQTR